MILKRKGALLILGIIGSLLFISLFGAITFHVKAFEFELSIAVFDHGFTEIIIPPIGKIIARTHYSPLRLNITLLNIDMNLLEKMLETTSETKEIMNEVKGELIKIALMFALRVFLLALGGGIFGAYFIYGFSPKYLSHGALIGLIVFMIFVGGTVFTYDFQKFETPEYRGVLQAAPWAIGLAEETFKKFNILGEQMQIMAQNFYTLFEKVNELGAASQINSDLKVLHVSDIHNNKASIDFIQQVVKSFYVDLVIDTGDLVDYGTPIEGRLIKGIKEINVPYLFIPGNHDSPQSVKTLKKYANVHVLERGVFTYKNFSILGILDPSSLSSEIVPSKSNVIEEYKLELFDSWERLEKKPNVVASHNGRIAKSLIGKAPLIIHGHNHQYSIQQVEGTILIDAGSAGAAGLRGLQATKEIPYSVVLMHFVIIDDEYKLVATDTIKVFNLTSGFNLERQVYYERGKIDNGVNKKI